MNTFIIGEAGSNHNRDFTKAKALINAAVEAKCDAVKFQTFSSDTLFSKYTPDFSIYKDLPGLIRSLELPRHWQKDLKDICDDKGIEFMSTPFDESAVNELVNIGVKRLKVAGFESTDFRFLRIVASTKLPLIVSLGIGSDSSMRNDIVQCIREENPSVELTVLHCNNCYPTPLEDINLGTILEIKKQFSYFIKVGLSDHTLGILIPPVAVGLGAECIEKHFTLCRNSEGPDHSFSIEPDELRNMVTNIRSVESAMGIKRAPLTTSEESFSMARRSVITKRFIHKGEVLSPDNITTKRPYLNNSVPAIEYDNMLGKKCLTDIESDKPVLLSSVL